MELPLTPHQVKIINAAIASVNNTQKNIEFAQKDFANANNLLNSVVGVIVSGAGHEVLEKNFKLEVKNDVLHLEWEQQ